MAPQTLSAKVGLRGRLEGSEDLTSGGPDHGLDLWSGGLGLWSRGRVVGLRWYPEVLAGYPQDGYPDMTYQTHLQSTCSTVCTSMYLVYKVYAMYRRYGGVLVAVPRLHQLGAAVVAGPDHGPDQLHHL